MLFSIMKSTIDIDSDLELHAIFSCITTTGYIMCFCIYCYIIYTIVASQLVVLFYSYDHM